MTFIICILFCVIKEKYTNGTVNTTIYSNRNELNITILTFVYLLMC
jgi:hypothetical protein